MNRQERRRIELIQPWSVPVMKTTLPPDVLQTMIEISDLVIADKDTEYVEHNILEQTGVMDFFLGAIRQFIIMCKFQINEIQQEEWLVQMLRMWIVSQQPGEYSPLHTHLNCQISSVMYLKIPKMLSSKKEHRPHDDGSISFVSNASRDIDFSLPSITMSPQVGDFYIFGAQQQHAVWPYRCTEGQKETERRSISFNAVFQSKTDYDAEQKYLHNETKK
jgi:hypothetical protein